jgi:hemolysin D
LVSDAARQHRAALNAQTKLRWLAELAELEIRLQSFVQEIIKAQARVNESYLAAPVAGTVQQLAVNTLGGVVGAAEKLMLIIPDGEALQIEAWISNKDIGFVHDGRTVEIKVETFPFTKYGVINGEIINVSNDAIPEENQDLVYLAQVRVARTTLWVKGKLVNLSVTIEVNMGKRRLIEYLLTPLLRYKDEGLQER